MATAELVIWHGDDEWSITVTSLRAFGKAAASKSVEFRHEFVHGDEVSK